ncbi:MAG: NADP-dependent malic enzyme [Candidatus Aminicenantia bacterium]
MITKEEALLYHSRERKGKLEIIPSKPCATQKDLSLAYTPGVAEPCRVIQKDTNEAYNYTMKGNLVAVITNGTAVLGLGNIGALAGKPVMEGKSVLFKRFADVDAIDVEIASEDPDEVIKVCQLIAPTYGGINLEDIKAPECFYIEEKLKETLDIPVFHDDQHGTAIISGAGLLNALELQKKDISKVRIVINGAGASGIACTRHFVRLGAKKENIILLDTKGVIYKGRKEGMNAYKEEFAIDTKLRTLEEAMEGSDVFIGLSGPNVVSKKMVASMNDKPIIFAMANPDPEIFYPEAISVRDDLIMGTGRSDYPNQVNNVLGFPFIFRGALDVRAKAINDDMKVAATMALANLAKEDVPDVVCRAYGNQKFKFGKEYVIPKPFDPRVLIWEASAVAEAAIKTGVARIQIDIEEYKKKLEKRLGRAYEVRRIFIEKAKISPKKIVFPEGEEENILFACKNIIIENIAYPILLGEEAKIKEKIKELGIEDILSKVKIIQPEKHEKFDEYVKEFYNMRQRKGVTLSESRELMKNKNYFGSMMVYKGDADGLISGLTMHYPDTIRPALHVIKVKHPYSRVAGLYMMVFKDDIMFFADTTVNIEPTAEDIAEIALSTAEFVKKLGIEPKIAMLSFSNFGSTRHPLSEKVRKAVEIVQSKAPNLIIDGEMQADTAVVPEIIHSTYPFSKLKEKANVLIFPDLQSANIAYKLINRLCNAEAIGPILLGMTKPIHVLQRGASVDEIVNLTAIAVVDAQEV